jgi:raffinose/stachyose/melibiose transport system permease protein
MYSKAERGVSSAILLIIAVITLYPIIVLVTTAFDKVGSSNAGISFFHAFSFSSFSYAWSQGGFSRYTLNTAIMTVSVVFFSVIFAVLAAYAVALLKPMGSRVLFYVSILAFMLPVEVLITPWYYQFRTLGWLNTYAALIVPQVAQSIAFGIFWMNAAFLAVPASLTEAALLDGATRRDLFRFVLLPNVMPAVKTMAALVFLWTWNAFLLPIVMVSKTSLFVVTEGLSSFQGAHFNNFGALAAGSVLAALPVVVVYLLSQRSFISGMFAGSSVG